MITRTFLAKLLVLVALAKSHSQQLDKQQHFNAGVVITAVASPFMSDEAALGVGIAAAIAEEMRDHRFRNNFDVKDAAYTIAGSVATYYIIKAIKKRKRKQQKQ